MAGDRWSAGQPRRWGPSSAHAKGIVMYALADGAVREMNAETIDRNVYLRLITRAGEEPVPEWDY